MKKFILLSLLCFLSLAVTANAEKIDETQIKYSQAIGNLYRIETHSAQEYVTDSQFNVLGGPYKKVSDNSGYCSAENLDGNRIMFDLDGTILAKAHPNYDMSSDEILIDYQTEYKFKQMDDKYIIVQKDYDEAVIDYSGNIVVPYSKSVLSLTDGGLISYYHSDGKSIYEGFLNPENREITEKTLDESGRFHSVLNESSRENIEYGTIVSNGKAADIREEDLQKFLDTYWNFTYERVIAPLDTYTDLLDKTYIKLWNKERSKSYVIYSGSGVIAGRFGEPSESHGDIKENYIWYMPVMGNGRNALHTAFEMLRHTYFDEDYEGYTELHREITEADKAEIPTDNLLNTNSASEWAKPEIQKAASCNLLTYELVGKYNENITRLEFCRLLYRTLATEFVPNSDSRTGVGIVIERVIREKGIADTSDSKFTDCYYSEVEHLAAVGIIKGMENGIFAPDEYITREQAAVILCRAAEFLDNKTLIKTNYHETYEDENKISDWAKASVASMKAVGIMKGISERQFAPKDIYTVEQAIATMLRLYECT